MKKQGKKARQGEGTGPEVDQSFELRARESGGTERSWGKPNVPGKMRGCDAAKMMYVPSLLVGVLNGRSEELGVLLLLSGSEDQRGVGGSLKDGIRDRD